MNILPLLLTLAFSQFSEAPAVQPILPVVEQSVECISIAHLCDGAELAFFWDNVQDDWTCLDHRWLSSTAIINHIGDEWVLTWTDESENCYRVISTKCWVESWETENPLAPNNQLPWFRQLLNPGLKQPPKVEIEP